MNFGNTSFGGVSQQQKPLGNFSFAGNTPSFGANNTFGATNPTPAFGASNTAGFGGTNPAPAFGATNTSQGFGGTNAAQGFGATNPSQGFGGTNPAPAFGATNTAPAFGSINQAPAFGANNPTTAFGAPNPNQGFGATQTAGPSFGGSLFGNTGATQPFNFGGTATSAAGGSVAGFGGSVFGATGTQPTTSASGFGFGGGNTFQGFGGGFGTTTTSAPPLFGGGNTGGFPSLTNSFGTGFGQKPNLNTGFGGQFQPQQFQQQQQQQQPEVPFNPDINVNIFNDERDAIIAKFNHLQALWGTGKAYFSPNAPPIEITSENYLNRFKAMAFCKLPKKDNKMGLVALIFNKNTITEISNQQHQIINQLNQIFGNKPNLTVNIESIQSIADSKTQVVIYVEEKSQLSNEIKRFLSTEVCSYLNQPMTKQQLINFGVEKCISLLPPDEDQIKEYLENAPKGIDPRMWRQAQLDNPDPKKFIPVPIMGYSELKARFKCQENEAEMHSLCLNKIEKSLIELKHRQLNTAAKIIEYRRKIAKLGHNILKIIVKQETTRKIEEALLPEEELIRGKLENIQSLVITPNEFKGRLNELVAQMKIHLNQWYDTRMLNEYKLDEDSSEEITKFLSMQQNAVSALIETVKKDVKALQIISEGVNQFTQNKH